jgi:hypothetical protein
MISTSRTTAPKPQNMISRKERLKEESPRRRVDAAMVRYRCDNPLIPGRAFFLQKV